MAPESSMLTLAVKTGSPYSLNPDQVLRASTALLKHIKTTTAGCQSNSKTLKLLDEDPLDSQPIWFQMTTKVHASAEKRLKPIKYVLPHPLNTDATKTICLFTTDPQITAKDLIASPAFPAALSARITRVIGLSKLRSKWSQYEAQRKLLREHDIFLADDRIINLLPAILGKTFYKSTTKRPVPVNIQQSAPKRSGKRIKKMQGDPTRGLIDAKSLAIEIESAIQSAVIYLSTSTDLAIRVGYASWSPEKIKDNVEALSSFLIERVVSKKWRGVKSMHIKGAETTSLPIWLAEEIWVDEKHVLPNNPDQAPLKLA